VPVAVAVIVLVFGALLIFSWRQFRAGGRWGSSPARNAQSRLAASCSSAGCVATAHALVLREPRSDSPTRRAATRYRNADGRGCWLQAWHSHTRAHDGAFRSDGERKTARSLQHALHPWA